MRQAHAFNGIMNEEMRACFQWFRESGNELAIGLFRDARSPEENAESPMSLQKKKSDDDARI